MSTTTTLLNCDQEPIHTPNAIQPCGYLLALEIPAYEIGIASDNCVELFDRPIEKIVNHPISSILSVANFQRLEDNVSKLNANEPESIIEMELIEGADTVIFDVRLRLCDNFVLVELDNERTKESEGSVTTMDIIAVQNVLMRLGKQSSVSDLAEAVAREVRKVTGFDRVMVYQFHPDFHGEVIAESVKDGWEPYLGLHYPESDIPAQARALYCRNYVRCIVSSDYSAVGITASGSTRIPMPLDMSDSHLRSVSPIHLQYLRNMGVGASMSISLMDNDVLWGLIACHHGEERFVNYHARKACELLGTTFSLMLLQLEEAEQSRELLRLQDIERQLLSFMSNTVPFVDGAFRHLPNLSNLVNADGAASITADVLGSLGETPSDVQITEFAEWLKKNDTQEILATHQIRSIYPPAEHWDNEISGVIVIEIARKHRQFLFCFLKRFIHTVKWAGHPEKIVKRIDGTDRLSPRESFLEWAETVDDESRKWTRMEITVAHTMRRAILHVIVDWTEEVAGLNKQLTASNDDLQVFAEIAAHDLKEPLRGIDNYVHFFLEDHQKQLDEEMRRKLSVISDLATRGNELTGSLLKFAEVSNSTLDRKMQSMDTIVDHALEALESRLDEVQVTLSRSSALPDAWVDEILITQVFQNLIGNSIKYARDVNSLIEIGTVDPSRTEELLEGLEAMPASISAIYYVRDNGIGMPEQYLNDIFKLFKRLHPRSQFGGGSGIGLSIARRIVEYHKGHIWADSELGTGSCFYFYVSVPADIIDVVHHVEKH